MGEIFSDFFLFFVLIKNGAAEVVERAVSCRRRSVRVCARARLRELLRAGGWQLRATATATATRRLGSGGGGTRRQRAVLAGAGGGGLAGLVASAASAVAASARSGGCRLQSWGRGRARARGVSFSFFSFLFPRVRKRKRKRKRKGIFADGGVEPGFGARGKAGWRTPRRWAATVGRAG